MKKLYYVELAKMFGLELEEEFKIESDKDMFRFVEDDLQYYNKQYKEWTGCSLESIVRVFDGDDEIIKIPFKPTYGDEYWCVCQGTESIRPIQFTWTNYLGDFERYALGNCFKTKKEAELHEDEVLKRIKEPYEKG